VSVIINYGMLIVFLLFGFRLKITTVQKAPSHVQLTVFHLLTVVVTSVSKYSPENIFMQMYEPLIL